jgi:opacity protein-like surface antigen
MKVMNYKSYSVLAMLAALFVSSPSQAKVEGFNIDALIGADLISGGTSSSSSNLGYGLRLGYHLDPTWEIGAGFTTATNSTSVATTVGTFSTSATTGLLMADINFHFNNEWNPLYLGARLGLGINSGSNNAPSAPSVATTTNLAYGIVGGYDFKVAESFTIGPRISYTAVTQSIGGNLADFQAHAAFKYFF